MLNLHIRPMLLEDAATITAAFQAQGWNKPLSQYLKYYDQQLHNERVVLIATLHHTGDRPLTLPNAHHTPEPTPHSTNQGSVPFVPTSPAFAGYITLLWKSPDPYFSQHNIPEIQDFNVLIAYRNQGIGSQLMDAIEEIAFEKHPTVGLSTGLLSDYGSAQRLYVKRGYIPTGEGIKYKGKVLQYHDTVKADDDLVLSFTKSR